MPNGGSDCCGTCWFNAKNKGEAGYDHSNDPEPDVCTIRNLEILDPFYTYCGNHPHRRPEPDPVPIGPAFTGDDDGQRHPLQPSPDSEEIRRHLLDLLGEMMESPSLEYPHGSHTDEVVVWQLGEFREIRAVAQLRRVASFDPAASDKKDYGRNREKLVNLAQEALDKIQHGDSAAT